DGVESVLRWRREIELLAQRLHETVAHLFPDADGAIALDVAVAAHWADTGAGAADLAAKQVEVGDGLHIGDAVVVLGDAHGPAGDHALGSRGDCRGMAYQVARDAGGALDGVPVG